MFAAALTFAERWSYLIHIAQILLIVLAMGLAVGRLTIKNPPAGRANMIALSMGAKSLIVIAYQMLTEHYHRFQKWASTKANAILNCLECIFWGAVVVLTGRSISGSGITTTLSIVTMAVALVLLHLSLWMAGSSVKIHRRAKTDMESYGSSTRPTQV